MTYYRNLSIFLLFFCSLNVSIAAERETFGSNPSSLSLSAFKRLSNLTEEDLNRLDGLNSCQPAPKDTEKVFKEAAAKNAQAFVKKWHHDLEESPSLEAKVATMTIILDEAEEVLDELIQALSPVTTDIKKAIMQRRHHSSPASSEEDAAESEEEIPPLMEKPHTKIWRDFLIKASDSDWMRTVKAILTGLSGDIERLSLNRLYHEKKYEILKAKNRFLFFLKSTHNKNLRSPPFFSFFLLPSLF